VKTYTIRGSRIHSRADFFAEIGYAVNGAGGYFGSNLDALADCLGGGYGTPEDTPFRFVLTDSADVKESLDADTWLGLLEVFGHSAVQLVLRD